MPYNYTSEHRPERIEYKKQFQAKTYVQLKFFTVKQPFDLIHEGVKRTISQPTAFSPLVRAVHTSTVQYVIFTRC